MSVQPPPPPTSGAPLEYEDDLTVRLPSRVQRHRVRKRWYAHPILVIGAVTAIAGGLRFYHLSFPHEYVFDEVYYAKDGCVDAGFNYKACKLENPGEQTDTVHPPLGRWIIAVWQRLHPAVEPGPARIPMNVVAKINSAVHLSVPRTSTTAISIDKWVDQYVISRIPGAGRDQP